MTASFMNFEIYQHVVEEYFKEIAEEEERRKKEEKGEDEEDSEETSCFGSLIQKAFVPSKDRPLILAIQVSFLLGILGFIGYTVFVVAGGINFFVPGLSL